MKALVYAGPKRVEVQEVKEPEKQDGKVKLNIRYCGLLQKMERNSKKVTELSLIRYFPVDTVLHAEVEMNMYVIHWD